MINMQETFLHIDGLEEELDSSMSVRESVRDWWERAHDTDSLAWLSGYPGPAIWERLEVEDRLTPGAAVLNIGVGMGYCTRGLYDRGCVVHALDISLSALDRVKNVAIPWHVDQLGWLPPNTFDVALSHLVAQHMLDDALRAQIAAVVRSLTRGGVFAMQFGKYLRGQSEIRFDERGAKGGYVRRTVAQVKEMVTAAGGTIIRSIPKEFSEKDGWAWHVVHIARA